MYLTFIDIGLLDKNILIDQIDFTNWILEDQLGMFETCARLNLLSDDGFHPSGEGYNYWIDKFVTQLKNDKIL